MKVNDIRKLFVEKYKNQEFVIDKTGIKTVEIVGAHFEADENYLFGVPNEQYIQKELAWYMSQSLNVNDIENTPKIWKQVADPEGFINSNYGWAIFSKENGYQYDNCLNELKQNPYTRRGAMIYNRPNMWTDYNKNGRSDFMCTYAVQFLVRNNTLYSLVFMRSNDAWAGYRNDFAWHKYVLDKLANDLNIKNTMMIWNAGSLHLYERQFYLIEEYERTN
jgi:thymidylate synthase